MESEAPCVTCIATCCRRRWHIPILPDEAERFGAAVLPLAAELADHPGPRFVGVLAKAADGACVYLGPDGCAVYEKRPAVCREFDARSCGIYAPDPLKQLGIRRLRIIEEEHAPSGEWPMPAASLSEGLLDPARLLDRDAPPFGSLRGSDPLEAERIIHGIPQAMAGGVARLPADQAWSLPASALERIHG